MSLLLDVYQVVNISTFRANRQLLWLAKNSVLMKMLGASLPPLAIV
jgi:hypothetical protein